MTLPVFFKNILNTQSPSSQSISMDLDCSYLVDRPLPIYFDESEAIVLIDSPNLVSPIVKVSTFKWEWESFFELISIKLNLAKESILM